MDPKDDAKAQVVIPVAYFRKLKRCWDEANRLESAQANDSSSQNSIYHKKIFRNIPRIKAYKSDDTEPLYEPPRVPITPSAEEDMEGAGVSKNTNRNKGILQAQRSLNLALTQGSKTQEDDNDADDIAEGVAADGHTEQMAPTGDVQEVAPVIMGNANAGAATYVTVDSPPRGQVKSIIPHESISYDNGDDWYYIG